MKVLVADKFEQAGVEGLRALGCEVLFQPDLKEDALTAAIAESGADVLVVRSTKVRAPMFDVGHLRLVVRAGAGYDNIDVAAASRRGIFIANCPGKNAIAVAELAFGLILALDRRIPDNVAELRAGKWNKKEYSKARGLYGRTLGLLGFGNIGQEMAKRGQAFGMNIAVWSEIGVEIRRDGSPVDLPMLVHLRPSAGQGLEPLVRVCNSPQEVAEHSDVMSVHLALSDRTRGVINDDVLGRLRKGAILINTARAEVMDNAAVERAVKEGGLRVGMDVYTGEPSTATADFAEPLASLPGVYGTHHIGASTDQAQDAIALETVRIVKTYLESGRVINHVNRSRATPVTHVLIVRHHDEPGVLADVFAALRAEHLNVQETENIVFNGAEAAVARINLDRAPSAGLVTRLREANPAIMEVSLLPVGAAGAQLTRA